jgi:non-ribosomal peptide synthetase component F
MTSEQGTLLASTLGKILQGVMGASAEMQVGQIDCLSDQSLEHIRTLNQAVTIDPVERCVHDIIAERVAEHPDKEAVVAWDGVLTYQQLDAYASQLAASLVKSEAVERNSIVPLCFDKSVRHLHHHPARMHIII